MFLGIRSTTLKKMTLLASLPTKQLLFLRRILSNSCSTHFHSSLFTLPSPSALRKPISKKKEINRSFTISYLIDSCGLSPERAISASEKLHFATPEKPDSVLHLLETHGFTKKQVALLVMKYPRVLLADAEKTLLPKLQFFLSIGFSKTNLAKTVCASPKFLARSVENHTMPMYNFLKGVVSPDKACVVMQRLPPCAISGSYAKCLSPNVTLLRKHQVPETVIAHLVTHFPEVVARSPEDFSETLNTVMEMGFSPLKSVFVEAMHALSGKSNKSIWDRSYKTYTKWGWSNDDILLAFKKQPRCMIMSEKKITRTMEFLVNKMGWCSKDIARSPGIFLYSLEKMMIPRCSVIRLLLEKGLLKKNYKVSTIMVVSEQRFIQKFVTKYVAQVPHLLSFYEGKKIDNALKI